MINLYFTSYKTVARGKISRSIQDLKVLEINFENVEVIILMNI